MNVRCPGVLTTNMRVLNDMLGVFPVGKYPATRAVFNADNGKDGFYKAILELGADKKSPIEILSDHKLGMSGVLEILPAIENWAKCVAEKIAG